VARLDAIRESLDAREAQQSTLEATLRELAEAIKAPRDDAQLARLASIGEKIDALASAPPADAIIDEVRKAVADAMPAAQDAEATGDPQVAELLRDVLSTVREQEQREAAIEARLGDLAERLGE